MLQQARQSEERNLRRKARAGDLTSSLVSRFGELADQVRAAAAALIDDNGVRQTFTAQALMKPTYVVGMEDLTQPVLTALGLETAYMGRPLAWFKPLAERAVDFATRTNGGAFGSCDTTVFAGLHGVDFDTAHQAGKLAGDAGTKGIATGLVGALKDKTFTDYRIENGTVIPLGGTAARPYLRVIEIVAGLTEGYAAATGRRPKLHSLGAGSPVLLPLLALLGDKGTYSASDSTAPIQDAFEPACVQSLLGVTCRGYRIGLHQQLH